MVDKPALDPTSIPARTSTAYPSPFDRSTFGRAKRSLTAELGLSQFGVNFTELAPGSASSIRHWHSHEDEFIYIISGEVVLVTDGGEQVLAAGMVAGFPAGIEDGHCIQNKSDQPAVVLEVGSRDMRDEGNYPDIALHCQAGRYEKVVFTDKKGKVVE